MCIASVLISIVAFVVLVIMVLPDEDERHDDYGETFFPDDKKKKP